MNPSPNFRRGIFSKVIHKFYNETLIKIEA